MASTQSDPAAEFAAALSLYHAVDVLAEKHGVNLSEAYEGVDECMRQCMRVGREFEAWACEHVDFDALSDVWPYLLEDKFGMVAAYRYTECELGSLKSPEDWAAIAVELKLPIYAHEKPNH